MKRLTVPNLRRLLTTRRLSRLFLLAAIVGLSTSLWLTFGPEAPPALACSSLPVSGGTASLALQVATAGTYHVWVQEEPGSSSATSFYLQIADAGACSISMGGSTEPADTWSWVDYKNGKTADTESVTIAAGTHTVAFAIESPHVTLDKVILLGDSCIPTGTGTNCTAPGASADYPSPSPSAPPVLLPLGQGKALTVSGDINVTPTNLPKTVKTVQYLVDGAPVASGKIDTTKLKNGDHTIQIKWAIKGGAVTTQTRTITVDNPSFLQAHTGLFITIGLVLVGLLLLAFIALKLGLFRAIKSFMDNVKPYIDQIKSRIANVPGLSSPSLDQIPPEDLPDGDLNQGMPKAPIVNPASPKGPDEPV